MFPQTRLLLFQQRTRFFCSSWSSAVASTSSLFVPVQEQQQQQQRQTFRRHSLLRSIGNSSSFSPINFDTNYNFATTSLLFHQLRFAATTSSSDSAGKVECIQEKYEAEFNLFMVAQKKDPEIKLDDVELRQVAPDRIIRQARSALSAVKANSVFTKDFESAQEFLAKNKEQTEKHPVGTLLMLCHRHRTTGVDKAVLSKLGLPDNIQEKHRILANQLEKFVSTHVTIRELANEKFLSLSHVLGFADQIATEKSERYVGPENGGFSEVTAVAVLSNNTFPWFYEKAVSSYVLVVGGSSGSGKTIVALQIAHLLKVNLRSSSTSHEPNRIIYLKDLLGTNDLQNCSTEKRDEMVVDLFSLEQEKSSPLKKLLTEKTGSSKTFVTDDSGSSYNVVIVLDEMGKFPVFVRGLCAVARELSCKLHEHFFGKTLNPKTEISHCRVFFIVVGTGLAVQTGEVYTASSTETFCTVMMDERPMTFKEMLKFWGLTETLEKRHPKLNEKLTRISDGKGETTNERVASALTQNRRSSSLLAKYVSDYVNASADDKVNLASLNAPLDMVLGGWLPVVVCDYVKKNGLNNLAFPLDVIKLALAASVFRLPALPRLEGDNVESTKPGILHEKLSTNAGVLVDTLVQIPSTSKDDDETKDTFTELSKFNIPTKNTVHAAASSTKVVMLPNDGRFYFSAAHLAMFSVLSGISRRPDNWAGLEHRIADFCVQTVALSPDYAEMKKLLLVDKHDKIEIIKFEEEVNAKHDPLWPLKQALVFDVNNELQDLDNKKNDINKEKRDLSVNVVQNEVQFAYPIRKEDEQESKRVDREEALTATCKNVKDGEVVVMLSAPYEPFCDVVVVGPNKLVFIEAKSRSGLGGIEVDKFFTRCNLFKDCSPSDEQKHYFEQLVKQCHVVPAADAASKSVVSITSVLLIEASVEQLKDGGDDKRSPFKRWSDRKNEFYQALDYHSGKTKECPSHGYCKHFIQACKNKQLQLEGRVEDISFVHDVHFIVIPAPKSSSKHFNYLFPALPSNSTVGEERAPHILTRLVNERSREWSEALKSVLKK
jgi:hypothetical protein